MSPQCPHLVLVGAADDVAVQVDAALVHHGGALRRRRGRASPSRARALLPHELARFTLTSPRASPSRARALLPHERARFSLTSPRASPSRARARRTGGNARAPHCACSKLTGRARVPAEPPRATAAVRGGLRRGGERRDLVLASFGGCGDRQKCGRREGRGEALTGAAAPHRLRAVAGDAIAGAVMQKRGTAYSKPAPYGPWRCGAGRGWRSAAPPCVWRPPERGGGRRKMAAAAAAALRAWFWNERFWLPHNVTWADLAGEAGPPGSGLQYPRASHVLSAFPLALGIFAVRLLFERFIAKPCAINLGIQDSGPHRAQPNAILEKVFTSITKSPDGKRLEGLSKQLDWDVRKIQRWFRHRRNQDKPTTLTKFCESMWRFTFYLSIFFYGIRFLWTAPWFWDTRQCWYNYPFQPLTSRLYYYYILELAFYWSLMFSQFTDIKRKDFLIMFVHHLATIGLITFSYMNNMVRVGTLVLCLHDASDFLLEAAKLANYAKYQRLCDAFFMLFGVVFIVTRLGIYPFWILNTTLFESWELIGPYPSWWLFNGLLVTLQVLHVIWSYLIIRTASKALVRGKVSKDDRSDVESSSEEEDVTSNSTKGIFSTSSNGSNRLNGHVAAGQWTGEE
ncbi:ceramide synthase 5 [Poecile atricapillus]|nr:ceramide synthase 5 [Poecile atricapillus]